MENKLKHLKTYCLKAEFIFTISNEVMLVPKPLVRQRGQLYLLCVVTS